MNSETQWAESARQTGRVLLVILVALAKFMVWFTFVMIAILIGCISGMFRGHSRARRNWGAVSRKPF